MEKSKYAKLIIIAAVLCFIAGGASAHHSTEKGVLIEREPSGKYEVSFQTEAGTRLDAIFGEEKDRLQTHASASDAGTAEYTVNINTATAEELDDLLPGIGKKKSAAIVEYRDHIGGFHSVEELIEVEGIGTALLECIRPYCVIGDE